MPPARTRPLPITPQAATLPHPKLPQHPSQLCYSPRWSLVPQTHSQILSHQACPRAGAPLASRAPNAPSRCVQATVPTTAPAPSTRATSPSADVYLASWVTVASTVSESAPGEGRGEQEPVGVNREEGRQVRMNQAQAVGAVHHVVTPPWCREPPGIRIIRQKECPA